MSQNEAPYGYNKDTNQEYALKIYNQYKEMVKSVSNLTHSGIYREESSEFEKGFLTGVKIITTIYSDYNK